MNRSMLARRHKLEARAGLHGSVENMTDAELFSTFLDLLERVGGAEALAETLRGRGEERLAESVLVRATCTTNAEFIAVEA
jgi:hypothetical protein